MLRFAALATVVACSHPPAPAPPAPVAPPPSPAPVAATPAPAATADTKADDASPPEWTGCLFSKAELVAEGSEWLKAAAVAPNHGFVLALALIERSRGSTHAFTTFIGLAKEPAPNRSVAVKATLNDDFDEMEGGLSTRYEIHGTIVPSADGATFDVTLASRQQPHMFDPGSPLAHFAVAVQRVHHANDCTYK